MSYQPCCLGDVSVFQCAVLVYHLGSKDTALLVRQHESWGLERNVSSKQLTWYQQQQFQPFLCPFKKVVKLSEVNLCPSSCKHYCLSWGGRVGKFSHLQFCKTRIVQSKILSNGIEEKRKGNPQHSKESFKGYFFLTNLSHEMVSAWRKCSRSLTLSLGWGTCSEEASYLSEPGTSTEDR